MCHQLRSGSVPSLGFINPITQLPIQLNDSDLAGVILLLAQDDRHPLEVGRGREQKPDMRRLHLGLATGQHQIKIVLVFRSVLKNLPGLLPIEKRLRKHHPEDLAGGLPCVALLDVPVGIELSRFD